VRELGERQGRRRRSTRALATLELVSGAAAIAGGTLLVVRPDGSLLMTKSAALAGTPFSDWRVPGVLLGTLVGGGGIVAGSAVLARSRYAGPLSVLFGAGLFGFEVVEACWIGFQPLELVFGAVGVGIVALAIRVPLRTRGAK